MTAELDVAISIIDTDNRELLRQCLNSLAAAPEGVSWIATVVDNACTDGSTEMLRDDFAWARVIRNERRLGFSANHNQVLGPVLADASAEFVLILNEDTVLSPGSIRLLVEAARANPRIGAVGPTLLGEGGDVQQSFWEFPTVRSEIATSAWPRRQITEATTAGWLNGSCILFRTAALRDVGSLDERFFIFYEDTDICRRLVDGGWDVERATDAVVVHLGHQTVSRAAVATAMERQMLRSRYLYLEKHHGRARARLAATGVRVALLARSVAGFLEWHLARRRQAREYPVLFQLAAYRPTVSLPHEAAARSG